MPIIFLPNRLFAPAPIKRKFDGGDTMKGTWATEKGSQRTGVEMKVDAHDHTTTTQVLENMIRGFRLEKAS